MIKVGQKVPNEILVNFVDGEVTKQSVNEILNGKNAVIFALPGAFTPTCSAAHLPGYSEKFDELTARGIDFIGCLSVNDAFVMESWK
ncbi:MAG: redoxin family protein, partial [Thalassobaculaceae bacterium]